MKKSNENSYGNKFGCHTPINSEESANKFFNQIKGTDFADGSWHNDECDSLWSEMHDICIFFPNCGYVDSEIDEFMTFNIELNVNEKYGKQKFIECESIEEVIEIIKQNL